MVRAFFQAANLWSLFSGLLRSRSIVWCHNRDDRLNLTRSFRCDRFRRSDCSDFACCAGSPTQSVAVRIAGITRTLYFQSSSPSPQGVIAGSFGTTKSVAHPSYGGQATPRVSTDTVAHDRPNWQSPSLGRRGRGPPTNPDRPGLIPFGT